MVSKEQMEAMMAPEEPKPVPVAVQVPQFNITAVEAHKLALQPGDVLAITIKSEDVDQEDLQNLGEVLKKMFTNNRVLLLKVKTEDSIDFSIVKPTETCENDCTGCVDHSCVGKTKGE